MLNDSSHLFSILKLRCLLFPVLFIFYFINLSNIFSQEIEETPANIETDVKNQITLGYYNLSFEKHVYYQYTGNPNFSKANMPSSYINIGYERVYPLDFNILTGVSFGPDFHYTTTTTSEVLGKKSFISENILMSLYMLDFSVKGYFFTPAINSGNSGNFIEDSLKTFFGIGWGILQGEFQGDGGKTEFNGMYTFRELGIMLMGESFGVSFSFQLLRADQIKANRDPFNQKNEDTDLLLNFGGTYTLLKLLYRF